MVIDCAINYYTEQGTGWELNMADISNLLGSFSLWLLSG